MSNGATIVSTTLPTIIGMGVVAKTTETMFGKGKRKSATRTTKSKSPVGSRKVHTGKRGGKYIKKNGRRVYI